jgi:hypothetical protein
LCTEGREIEPPMSQYGAQAFSFCPFISRCCGGDLSF